MDVAHTVINSLPANSLPAGPSLVSHAVQLRPAQRLSGSGSLVLVVVLRTIAAVPKMTGKGES